MDAHAFFRAWGFNGDNGRHGLLAMMNATAYRPFVYRRLTPDLIGAPSPTSRCRGCRLAPSTTCSTNLRLRRERGEYGGTVDESLDARKAVAFHVAYLVLWMTMFEDAAPRGGLLFAARRCSPLEAIVTACLGDVPRAAALCQGRVQATTRSPSFFSGR